MVLDTQQATRPPPKALAIDEGKLLAYLRSEVPALRGANSLHVMQFSHGQSNPTYLLEVDGAQYVLRKKPPGQVLTSAHAVDREYHVLSALAPTPVPVPAMLTLCTDASVIGTPFYIMEHVAGRIFLDPGLPELGPDERTTVYRAMAATLAKLHSVRPADVGLQAYGPAKDYSRRQVSRWARQYAAQLAGPPLPEMQRLSSWLQAHVPPCDADEAATRISHGDFRIDNLVLHPSDPGRVLAVLDWELSTLGHPYADLAYNCMPYHLRGLGIQGILPLPLPLPAGVPEEGEYVAWYCQARGVALPQAQEWAFFMALALFRIAAILAGVGARAKMGNASARNAAEVGSDASVTALARRALEIIDRASSSPVGPMHAIATAVAAPASGSDGSAAGFEPSPRVQPLLAKLQTFMAQHVYPAQPAFNAHASSDARWTPLPLIERLKEEAKAAGLWNLWLPREMAQCIRSSIGDDARLAGLQLGAGLSNLEYAFLSEVMGRVWWASEVFNSSAPDTGNMEVLARYGSPAQQREWLVPLLDGSIRSCFAMTEPAVASSDATNIGARIALDAPRSGQVTVTGHKWWTSGAMDPRCAVAIVMGKTDPAAPTHAQQSMVLVPMAARGVRVLRPLSVFGYDDAPHGHAEVTFEACVVPAGNIILGPGRGFEIAQGRLGPGRLHHCMRCVGMGSRAYELMARRALQRTAFGKTLAAQGAFQAQLAQAHIQLQAARLLVLSAAHALDRCGAKEARHQIAAAKVFAPNAVLQIIDTAIQVCGGAGVSDDLPLAGMYAQARTLRIADGPDDVHLASIAKSELRRMSKL